MPKKPDDEPYKNVPKGYAKQVGSSLSYWTAASIYGFFGHPEYARLAEYERAATTDETIGTGVEFIKLAILASLGPYCHPNPKIRDFVVENFARMRGNHRQAIGELTDSILIAGFGVSEAVYKADAGRIWLDFMASYNPRTLTMYVNAKGQLTEGEKPVFNEAFTTGIWQDRFGSTPIRLPLERCCLVTHNRRFNNYYGQSAIKRVYKNWRLKESVLEMWNVALDRYGTPVVYAVVPNGLTGKTIADPGAPGGFRPETIGDSAEGAIGNIHTGTGLVLEQPGPNDKITLGTLTTGNNFGDSFISAVSYFNKAIYRGLLIPGLLLHEQENGSLGSGGTAAIHFEVFKMMLRSMFAEIVEPFVEQVIGPLVRINFGEQNPGYFEMNPWDPATCEMMSKVLETMVETGFVDNTDIDDINMARQKVGLDPMTEKRARRLSEVNHANMLQLQHAEQESVELRSVSSAPPQVTAGRRTDNKQIRKSGGGSGQPAGAPKGNQVTVETQEQMVTKPLKKPPPPAPRDPDPKGSPKKAAFDSKQNTSIRAGELRKSK
jgi:hypothetical protein